MLEIHFKNYFIFLISIKFDFMPCIEMVALLATAVSSEQKSS